METDVQNEQLKMLKLCVEISLQYLEKFPKDGSTYAQQTLKSGLEVLKLSAPSEKPPVVINTRQQQLDTNQTVFYQNEEWVVGCFDILTGTYMLIRRELPLKSVKGVERRELIPMMPSQVPQMMPLLHKDPDGEPKPFAPADPDPVRMSDLDPKRPKCGVDYCQDVAVASYCAFHTRGSRQ